MAAAVPCPPQPLGGSTTTANPRTPTTMGVGGSCPPPLKTPDQFRRELMIEYAFAEYRYVITEDEADEIFFKPHWWADVDAFVQYMQDVNFGTPVAGTTNVKLPGAMHVYTDAELDAMEETGNFYPPTQELGSSSDGDSSYADSEDEFLLEEEEWEEEEPEMSEEVEEEVEEEEEYLPLYESVSKWAQRRMRNVSSPPPDYSESFPPPGSVAAMLADISQRVNELRIELQDPEEEDDELDDELDDEPAPEYEELEVEEEDEPEEDEPEDEQPEIEQPEVEPEVEQLDELSTWLTSLPVPAAPSPPIADGPPTAEEEEATTAAVPDTPPQSPFPAVVVEAVEVTLQVALPAVVVVKKKESSNSLLSTTSAPTPAPTPTPAVVASTGSLPSAPGPAPGPVPVPASPSRRERFDRRVRRAKRMLSRRLRAVCIPGLSS